MKINLKTLRSLASKLIADGKTEQLVNELFVFGAKRLADLRKSDYSQFHTALLRHMNTDT